MPGGKYSYPYLNRPSGVPIPLFKEPHAPGWHPRVMAGNSPELLPTYGFPAPGVNNLWSAVYDTWSYHYENDGLDQDRGSNEAWRTQPQAPPGSEQGLDQGANGLDDDDQNGVDDAYERETSPPYDTPLRGMKIILRAYERDTRQIRETSVTHSFVP